MAAQCQMKAKFQFLLVVLNILHYAYGLDIGNISCSQNLENLIETYKISEKEVTVECPSSCIEEVYCAVRGSNPYLPTSYVCCAAIHSGVVDNLIGGRALIRISSESVSHFFGSKRYGIRSKDYPASSIQSFTVAEPAPSQTQPSEVIDVHLTEPPPTSSPGVAEAREKHRPPTTPPVTTKRIDTTTEPPRRESPTTPLPPRTKLKSVSTATTRFLELITQRQHKASQYTTIAYNNGDSGMHFLDSEHLPTTIGVLIGVFIVGVVIGGCFFFLCRRCRKKKRHQHCGGAGRSKSKNTSRMEDPEICVCYQNLNSSKQGLLTDPETCDRPCPIRQPSTFNRDVTMSEPPLYPAPSAGNHREALSCSARPLISLETETRDCDAPYEDCASGCSGKCNPSQFDF